MKLPTLTDADFIKLYTFVRSNFGINLEKKRTLVEARLTFFIFKRGFCSFGEYLKYVTGNPGGEECKAMLNRLSTNYTFFFRESRALNMTGEKILPELAGKNKKKIRIWVAACASGEEAYSLAMVLEHTPLVRLGLIDYSIYGTDINTELLEKARKGIYDAKQLTMIPPEYRKYVMPQDDKMRICREIRDKIKWRYENLMTTCYREAWEIIFCRNVMFYFKAETREQLVARLYNALRPHGYLILGSTENVDLERRLFEHLEPTVYRKS